MIERLPVRIPEGVVEECSSPELTLCANCFPCPFHPLLPQWHIKDPSHSAKSTGGRLHLNMHIPLTQQSWSGLTMPLSRQSVGTLSGNELTGNSSGNTQSQSSQLTEPLWTDPGLNSGISVHELISTLKKKCRLGINCRTFSQNLRTRRKSHQHHWLSIEHGTVWIVLLDGRIRGAKTVTGVLPVLWQQSSSAPCDKTCDCPQVLLQTIFLPVLR